MMNSNKRKWPLTITQKKLYIAAVQTHEAELRPMRAYQEEQLRLLLESFAMELGIKKGSNVRFEGRDVKSLHFSLTEEPKKASLSQFRGKKKRKGRKSA
jgi:hypothetical protein